MASLTAPVLDSFGVPGAWWPSHKSATVAIRQCKGEILRLHGSLTLAVAHRMTALSAL